MMNRASFLFPFVLLACVIFALENYQTALALIAAMLFHEVGHIMAIKSFGGKVFKTSTSSVGANIEFAMDNLSLWREILVYAAGPCAGIIMGIIGYFLGFVIFAYVSFYISALNLLPCVPFDGGGILSSVLPYEKSYRVLKFLSIFIGLLMCIVGLYFIKNGGNFTVFVSGIGVFVSLVCKSSLQ